MTLPNYFKPKKKFSLIRLGKNNDGGYLVGKKTILESEILISLGIGDDWSFESDFLKINNQSKIIMYDRYPLAQNYFLKESIKSFLTIDFKKTLFNIKKFNESKIFFSNNKVKKRLIRYKSLDKIFQDEKINGKVFLKIDIEGSEYRILQDIFRHKHLICGLVIEFHDIDFHQQDLKNFIENLDLNLTHVHANNASVLDLDGNPTCLELTFEKNPDAIGDVAEIPNALDQKNLSNVADHLIIFKE